MEGEPLDDRRMLWTMTYRVRVGGDVVYERQALSMWHTCGPDDVADEVAALGLVVERPDADHVVLRRRLTDLISRDASRAHANSASHVGIRVARPSGVMQPCTVTPVAWATSPTVRR